MVDALRRDSEVDRELVDLMAAYQRGSIEAFEGLYGRIAPRLRGYLSSLSWSASRAEDLLQDTLLQLHRSRHTYISPRPVLPWAFAIARHVFLMDRRARVRRARVEVSQLEELPDVPIPAAMEAFATRRAVIDALAGLNVERREAVLLHHVWGFTFAEIGSMLGIREGTAKLRAHRAVSALRETLAGE